ncbi:hypothetical protein L3Q82_005064 [Scortum barcoo]|uniref:Uncharacterized protein n=1 Tax=Scortum barcoo TaxID=214431 RepID=A0ACB8VEQ4_9TELE|nr:hypothetical protein L3Q82_005064 [Scortum barcoo]
MTRVSETTGSTICEQRQQRAYIVFYQRQCGNGGTYSWQAEPNQRRLSQEQRESSSGELHLATARERRSAVVMTHSYQCCCWYLLLGRLQFKLTAAVLRYYGYTERFYGSDIAAAYYILSMKGGFRFAGQSEWFRADKRGKFTWDFLEHKNTPLEEVNMSYTDINYTGLENLEGQRSLRTLSVRGCPEVDDWFLARLHVLQDSLEELDISHCPRITTGGLAALRNLKGLRRLDMSSLPGISSPGLVIILLEEMLPQCQITATGYDLSLRQEEGEGNEEQMQG